MMYEVNQKLPFSWGAEITVSMTMKELAIMYSLLAHSSTSDAERSVKKCFTETLDVTSGDPCYKLYDDVRNVLNNNGVMTVG